MKTMKNERGYALLAVLLLIVLVLGVTATFMAGSLNNAKQEKTIDTSNQSVAAAEMGVLYYSTDFERALDLINKEVTEATTIELNLLISCLKSTNITSCDSLAKRKAWEADIDNRMKKLFVEKILIKINELTKIKGVKTASFNSTATNYVPQSLKIENVTYTDSELSTVSPTLVTKIVNAGVMKVNLEIVGTSSTSPKKLNSLFSIIVPPTFLNQQQLFNVDQTIIANKEDTVYTDVFKTVTPTQSCSLLLANVIAKKAVAPYECNMVNFEKLSDFYTQVMAVNVTPKLNPKDFWVYVNDFQKNACAANCNNVEYYGFNVLVKETDTGFADRAKNMNNMVNGNLIVSGTLTTQNINNLGKDGTKMTVVVKELDVSGGVMNLDNTNLMILGKTSGTDSRLKIAGKLEIDKYSRLCLDIDRIHKPDLDALAGKVVVSNGGLIVYYSSDPQKIFALTGADAVNRTNLYVKRADDYAIFLSNCGVTMKSTQSVSVSSPGVTDTKFDFEVNY